MIANYFGTRLDQGVEHQHAEDCNHSEFPRTYNMQLTKKQDLRYGENSHQDAAFYVENNVQEKFRKTTNSWDTVLTEYHCTKGHQHKFSHEEYLMKLRGSKYGLCLRGYGWADC